MESEQQARHTANMRVPAIPHDERYKYPEPFQPSNLNEDAMFRLDEIRKCIKLLHSEEEKILQTKNTTINITDISEVPVPENDAERYNKEIPANEIMPRYEYCAPNEQNVNKKHTTEYRAACKQHVNKKHTTEYCAACKQHVNKKRSTMLQNCEYCAAGEQHVQSAKMGLPPNKRTMKDHEYCAAGEQHVHTSVNNMGRSSGSNLLDFNEIPIPDPKPDQSLGIKKPFRDNHPVTEVLLRPDEVS
ncbi:unnamed protein product, partial [Owenia fusiformis]